jgi:PmbA protein
MALELEKLALAVDPRITTDGCAVVYGAGGRRIVNSKGLDVSFRDNALGAYVSAVAREGERAGSAYRFRMERGGVPGFEKIARQASGEAIDFLSAAPVASGRYPVVLRASAAQELLAAFADAFSADEAQRGLSKLKGREGEIVAAACLTLKETR